MLTLPVVQAFGQADTIIVYKINTQTIDTILPISFDSTITFDKTTSSFGSFGSQTALSLLPPTTNLFSNSDFSELARAELFFNVSDYPIRAATRLFNYKNGVLASSCSGIMVANDLVLTAGHCAYNYINKVWGYDSIQVAPSYNNGLVPPALPSTMVDKVYIFKTFYDKKSWDDVALLQLRQPIGQQTGWIGIAFNSDTSYFTGKVFHKLSYPSITSPFDTTRHYNGDTLYYNYGYIDKLPPNNLGINSPQALGITGQSGSSFFYTDNIEYFSFGVMSYSNMYRHYQFTKNIFHQFKNIINTYSTATQEVLTNENMIKIYPNPFNSYTTIQLNKTVINAEATIFNLYGQQVKNIKNIFGQKIIFHRDNIPSGLYFIHITKDNKIISTSKLIITDN